MLLFLTVFRNGRQLVLSDGFLIIRLRLWLLERKTVEVVRFLHCLSLCPPFPPYTLRNKVMRSPHLRNGKLCFMFLREENLLVSNLSVRDIVYKPPFIY